jgi:hypothetical protein
MIKSQRVEGAVPNGKQPREEFFISIARAPPYNVGEIMSKRYRHLPSEQYRTFRYLHGFVAAWNKLGLTDDDLRELESLILETPEAGDVIVGSGGLRKLRFPPAGWNRGKRGALRIGYAHNPALEKVVMIAVYEKQDKANLTASERRQIRIFLDRFWDIEAAERR